MRRVLISTRTSPAPAFRQWRRARQIRTPPNSACRRCLRIPTPPNWACPADPDPDATQLGLPPAARSRTQYLGTSGGIKTFGDAAVDLVGHPLGTRYRIQRLLGAGGMGAVYEAWDNELGVVVALKTVRPEIAADPESARVLERRFKQELLLARQVTHKNIVRVHDMGEVDGIKYITMPYLEGEDLSTILAREGKLPVERVMPIARQVVSGLVAAHEAGVVHRDLKPPNIMIDTAGDALIMDFGVASSTGAPKPISAPGPDGRVRTTLSADQTQMGSVVGTVAYMAPEQARAEHVDQRADIYAFGLILYDVLVGGSRAKRTDSVIAELNLRMKTPPPSPRSIDPAIPEQLDRIIMRCIQPVADDRYAKTADLLDDLSKLDDHGNPLPIMRRLTWRIAAGAAVLVLTLLGATWWLARPPAPPVHHDPVSVLIADFTNSTGDASFERTLEPMMKIALEDADFISAYDRSGIRRSLGVRPPETLDERAALEMAVKQGVNVVLSGSVDRRGSGFTVSVKATQAVTGTVIATESERASNKDQVLSAATKLATSVREALGDDSSGSNQRFAMETISATSLEAVREYAQGMEALSRSRFDDALQDFSKAVVLDPNFGIAYGAQAIAARNLDRQKDAVTHVNEAMRHLDSMTERERYRTRGMFYYLTSDYQSCVKEYSDLIEKYAADAAARNNLALCSTYLRDMPKAVEEMEQVVKILPNRALYRENLALYRDYSGDFETAAQEVTAMQDPGLFAQLALAFAQLGEGKVTDADATYRGLQKVDEQGASYTTSGLGDLASYEGNYSEAARVLSAGATADLASDDAERAANKFAAIAFAELQRNQKAAAVAAADKALTHSKTIKIRFLAGRIFAQAGEADKARTLAAGLAAEFQAEPQSYARIIEGLIAMTAGDAREAIPTFTQANKLLDTWISHFELGRAYLEANAFAQASSEFDRCIKRRGEALALFLDEEPTFAFFPRVYFYQGRAREGLNMTNSADSYRAYVEIRGKSKEDPLLATARKRAGG